MEEREGRAGGFKKDTADRLLRQHFSDGRTRGRYRGSGGRDRARRAGPGAAGGTSASRKRLVVAVNGDAQLLMAEMLSVFVREAAARAARQAQAEDLKQVDIEHLEKVLPQLVLAGTVIVLALYENWQNENS
ncbi:Centromere protein X [Willisornis vidua]|uniref:Centromere protein X n=1 Tax=Willisornis vidua TaxID=1566151 RepID=A0ABQ9DMM8_9PASS|nr:Centromere protein X [Willisornis vidua]